MANAPQPASEVAWRNGLVAMDRRCYKESIALFQQAIDLERQEGTMTPKMKFVSYLGLALTLSQGKSEEGQRLCEQAVKREFFEPDLFCNLGIVYLRNRLKAQAFESVQKGLSLKPGHTRILEELEKYERRGVPFFAYLPRDHMLNRLVGRVRSRLRQLVNSAAAEQT